MSGNVHPLRLRQGSEIQPADNDFGAENVASNPATARTTCPEFVVRSTSGFPNRVPVIGSRPSNTVWTASVATSPWRPSWSP